MKKYVALLRGINVGGNKQIPMKKLVEVLEKMGFKNVKTILASGNVVFEADRQSENKLADEIAKSIMDTFGFPVPVQVRSFTQIQTIVKENPFAELTKDQNFHWYVTFLNSPLEKTPTSPNAGFQFLSTKHDALFSTVDRRSIQSTDCMVLLDKLFGKGVTTRNWNTILKMNAV